MVTRLHMEEIMVNEVAYVRLSQRPDGYSTWVVCEIRDGDVVIPNSDDTVCGWLSRNLRQSAERAIGDKVDMEEYPASDGRMVVIFRGRGVLRLVNRPFLVAVKWAFVLIVVVTIIALILLFR